MLKVYHSKCKRPRLSVRAQGREARGALRSLREEESKRFVQIGRHAPPAVGEHVPDLVRRRMHADHQDELATKL